ncbi:type I methionyl aminopeptidase [Candidatus Omnitrophota bacterium]
MIKLKSAEEIKLIRDAAQVAVEVLMRLREKTQPGITTNELDQLAEKLFKQSGAVSAFKGYRGYPANICTSVNEEIVHGIPGKRKLLDGDIISLDVGAKLNGYFGDVASTFAVGKTTPAMEKLLNCAQKALAAGIAQARAGNRLLDISNAVQSYVEAQGYSVVRKFVGHGIGTQMHEEPEIPNFGEPGLGPELKAGMVLAIEPMVNEGTHEVIILKDKWTAVTKDSRLSAHFEHTVCITEAGVEILTPWE